MSTALSTAVPHKEQLLRHGTKLFYSRGYHGTTVDTLLESAQVPKGSFYHHFGTKQAFAQAVLARYNEFQMGLVARWADRTELPAAEAVQGYFDEIVEVFVRSGHSQACLAGKFSTELSASSEVLRLQIAEALAEWRDALAEIVQRGIDDGNVSPSKDPTATAESVLAVIQGALVVALANHDEVFLEHMSDTIRRLVAE